MAYDQLSELNPTLPRQLHQSLQLLAEEKTIINWDLEEVGKEDFPKEL